MPSYKWMSLGTCVPEAGNLRSVIWRVVFLGDPIAEMHDCGAVSELHLQGEVYCSTTGKQVDSSSISSVSAWQNNFHWRWPLLNEQTILHAWEESHQRYCCPDLSKCLARILALSNRGKIEIVMWKKPGFSWALAKVYVPHSLGIQKGQHRNFGGLGHEKERFPDAPVLTTTSLVYVLPWARWELH